MPFQAQKHYLPVQAGFEGIPYLGLPETGSWRYQCILMFSHVLKQNNQGVINLGLFLDPESLPTEQKLSFEVFIAADSLQKMYYCKRDLSSTFGRQSRTTATAYNFFGRVLDNPD